MTEDKDLRRLLMNMRKVLKKLFAKPNLPEEVKQSVLANQFVAGPELKSKVVSTDGNLKRLMMKARG